MASDAKYKGEHQHVPMHSALVEHLKALCKGKVPEDPVFDVPRKQAIVGLLHKDCQKAGIDTKRVDFHALRHTYISHLAAQKIRPEILRGLKPPSSSCNLPSRAD